MNPLSTYRPPRGCAFLLFGVGAVWLGLGLGGVLTGADGFGYGAFVCFAIVIALAVVFGILGLLARITVDDRGLRMFHEPFRLNTAAFSWDDVEWWQQTQALDPETKKARTVVEFHIRGWQWPFTVEPVAVAVPGMEAFLADVRARIGTKERVWTEG